MTTKPRISDYVMMAVVCFIFATIVYSVYVYSQEEKLGRFKWEDVTESRSPWQSEFHKNFKVIE